eukprot:4718019-Pyramimonas_sp.AAC.1
MLEQRLQVADHAGVLLHAPLGVLQAAQLLEVLEVGLERAPLARKVLEAPHGRPRRDEVGE